MLLGGGYDETGDHAVRRWPCRVIPARLAPQAVTRVLEHYIANRGRRRNFPRST